MCPSRDDKVQSLDLICGQDAPIGPKEGTPYIPSMGFNETRQHCTTRWGRRRRRRRRCLRRVEIVIYGLLDAMRLLDHTAERSGALDCRRHFQNSTATRRLRIWETHMDLAFGPASKFRQRFTAFNGNIRRLTSSFDRPTWSARDIYVISIVRKPNTILYSTAARAVFEYGMIRGVDTQFMNMGRKFTFITIRNYTMARMDISRVASWWSNREVGWG
jgi:hypothetical protein